MVIKLILHTYFALNKGLGDLIEFDPCRARWIIPLAYKETFTPGSLICSRSISLTTTVAITLLFGLEVENSFFFFILICFKTLTTHIVFAWIYLRAALNVYGSKCIKITL